MSRPSKLWGGVFALGLLFAAVSSHAFPRPTDRWFRVEMDDLTIFTNAETQEAIGLARNFGRLAHSLKPLNMSAKPRTREAQLFIFDGAESQK